MLTYDEFIQKLETWYNEQKPITVKGFNKNFTISIYGKGACVLPKNKYAEVTYNNRLLFELYKDGNFQFLEEQYYVAYQEIGVLHGAGRPTCIHIYSLTNDRETLKDGQFVCKGNLDYNTAKSEVERLNKSSISVCQDYLREYAELKQRAIDCINKIKNEQ